ncbi:MAG: DNA-binding protein [Rhizobium sp.]|jgi:predicted DNA-binding transcriptional regulator AlpA|nr:helix-turn-helix domain-containing protein [Rhizobium sp.]
MQDNRYLSLRNICERYSVTRMTVHRWIKHPTMGFPAPMVINSRSYFLAAEIEAWERRRAAGRAVA